MIDQPRLLDPHILQYILLGGQAESDPRPGDVIAPQSHVLVMAAGALQLRSALVATLGDVRVGSGTGDRTGREGRGGGVRQVKCKWWDEIFSVSREMERRQVVSSQLKQGM